MIKKLLTNLEEVRACRDLSGVPFDFGAGIVTNDSTGSEDAYYEMQEQDIIDRINDVIYLECGCFADEVHKSGVRYSSGINMRMSLDEIRDFLEDVRLNNSEKIFFYQLTDPYYYASKYDYFHVEKGIAPTSHKRKREDKRRLKYMVNKQYDEENDNYYHKRYYLSGRKSFAKKMSNKKVRKYRPYVPLKGAEYRKVYDYWWTVY